MAELGASVKIRSQAQTIAAQRAEIERLLQLLHQRESEQRSVATSARQLMLIANQTLALIDRHNEAVAAGEACLGVIGLPAEIASTRAEQSGQMFPRRPRQFQYPMGGCDALLPCGGYVIRESKTTWHHEVHACKGSKCGEVGG